jgi:hypothetical protein
MFESRYFAAGDAGCASTGSSKAMNSTHGVTLKQVAECGSLAGPYPYPVRNVSGG